MGWIIVEYWVLYDDKASTGCPLKLFQLLFIEFLGFLGVMEYFNSHFRETYHIWKVRSPALSWVQKHFYTISSNRHISKRIWGITFQEFEMMNNLISWNLIMSIMEPKCKQNRFPFQKIDQYWKSLIVISNF